MFRTTENLIPNVIRRQQDRQRPYATIVGIDGPQDVVTFADLENYSNRAAWFLEKLPCQKVLYMGPNDIRYAMWAIGAIKTGKCILFPSPANQISANQKFFETVGCKTLLYAPEAKPILAPLMEATRTTIECVVSSTYDEMMSKATEPVYPFEKTFDEVAQSPFLGLHTSGTSGHPKPIFWNHVAISSLVSYLDLSICDADGNSSNLYRELTQGNDVFVPFPLFHFGGMGNVMGTMYSDTTLVFPAPGTTLTPQNLTLILQKSGCTAAAVPPSLLEAMLNHPPGMEALARLKHIAYTGGPLNPLRGKALAEKLPHLFTVLASTEGGVSHLKSTGDSSHWNAFKFIDVGQRMDEVSPGIFELVFPRSDRVNQTYAFFHTHPHLDLEFRTSDLFSPLENENGNEVESKRESGWWVYRGRADNWIAMSNGLKMDPTEMENAIASHPDVTGVLVAGSYRFRLCLLIELAQKEVKLDQNEMLEKLWPTIEAANTKAPKFGRVPKELVLFATPEKPFLRAGKGTIQRRLTVQAYEKEINDLYDNVEEGLLVSGLSLPVSLKAEDLISFLEALCSETLLNNGDSRPHTISVDADLLALGLDSLSAFMLLARLKAALRKYGVEAGKIQKVDNKLLFSATTIRQLAMALSRAISHQSDLPGVALDDMSKLLVTYESQIRELVSKPTEETGDGPDVTGTTDEQAVVLTGSTGSVGSYILSSLLSRPAVKKIICLSRTSSPHAAQISSFRSRGLIDTQLHDGEGRLKFLQIVPAAPRLGLSDDDYDLLTGEATHIIHNAYPVNFLLSVGAFAPQLDFLLSLMNLAKESRHKPDIMFVSSITAAMRTNSETSSTSSSTIIEERVLEKAIAEKELLDQGYARSKYVCERLLEQYVSATGNTASVLRVGQVCGPVSGTGIRFWNPTEWLPSLVLSSKFLGAVPESLGVNIDAVDWVPVDKLGEIICDIAETSATQKTGDGTLRVFNIVHPTTTSWKSLLPSVVQALEAATGKSVDIVSPSEWLQRLEKCEQSPHAIHDNPAIKLLAFFQQTMLGGVGAAHTVVEKANVVNASKTAAKLQPIDAGSMALWMKGWGIS